MTTLSIELKAGLATARSGRRPGRQAAPSGAERSWIAFLLARAKGEMSDTERKVLAGNGFKRIEPRPDRPGDETWASSPRPELPPTTTLAMLYPWLDARGRAEVEARLGVPGQPGAASVFATSRLFAAKVGPLLEDRRAVFRAAGWVRTTSQPNLWFTTEPGFAAPFRHWMVPAAKTILARSLEQRRRVLAASRDSGLDEQGNPAGIPEADFAVPCPEGESYAPFQRAGIHFGLSRPNRNLLLADDMGLGKTVESLGIVNGVREARRVLVIPPADLKVNWAREAAKWLVRRDDGTEWTVAVASPRQWPDLPLGPSGEPEGMAIINYDILDRFYEELRRHPWDLVIVDEGHSAANNQTLRYKHIFGGRIEAVEEEKPDPGFGAGYEAGSETGSETNGDPENKAPRGTKKRYLKLEPIPRRPKTGRLIVSTGTPALNRPVQMFYLLHQLDPIAFPSWKRFTDRYCAPKLKEIPIGKGRKRTVVDTSGASNLPELQRRLRSTVMVRRVKAQVLKDLPPKTRQIIELPRDMIAGADRLIGEEATAFEEARVLLDRAQREAVQVLEAHDDPAFRQALGSLRSTERHAFNEIARARKELAIAKVPLAVRHLERVLEADGKVVVFSHHKEVARAIAAALNEREAGIAVQMIGDMSQKRRQIAKDSFQEDRRVRAISATYGAGGVGHTLTAASTLVGVEFDWVPAIVRQAEDRIHRYGQLGNVLIQFLAIEGTIDARLAQTLMRKLKVLDELFDKDPDAVPPVMPWEDGDDPVIPPDFTEFLLGDAIDWQRFEAPGAQLVA